MEPIENRNAPEGAEPIPWRQLLYALVSTIPVAISVLAGSSLRGLSVLLVGGYVASWCLLIGRFAIHIKEHYLRAGLLGPLLGELATVGVLGFFAWLLLEGENPQIPKLIGCSFVATVFFWLSADHMERRRAEQLAQGFEVRRATEFLRGLDLWSAACIRVRNLGVRHTDEIADRLSRPDTDAGYLSRLTFTALFVAFAIFVIAAGGALAGTLLDVPLNPGGKPKKSGGDGKGSGGTNLGEQQGSDGATCGDPYKPGRGVPEPERSSLILGWEEVDGLHPGKMEALGYKIAGCPTPAQEMPEREGWWYASGYCGDELRSIAIAPDGLYHPVMLLEQAASFAQPLIADGEFELATDRFHVGDGDAYIVNTEDGSYVLIRDHSSAGPIDEPESPDSSCGNFDNEDVPYAIVGPGLIAAWRAAVAVSSGGVFPIAAGSAGGARKIAFRSPNEIVAIADCAEPQLKCTTIVAHEPIAGTAAAQITKEEVIALATP